MSTVQIKLNNGNIINVKEGSALHNTYKHTVQSAPQSQSQLTQHNMANNQQRQQQAQQQYSSPKPQQNSYQTIQPQQSSQSSYNQSSQSSYTQPQQSVSSPQTGVNSSSSLSAPSFNVSSSTNALLQQLREQEALANKTWNTAGQEGYNDIWKQRNKISGDLLNAILKDSGGKSSLSEIESILGRRVENQEFDSYRNAYNDGNQFQQSQLNNLWEHDFANRNNGEHYQYLTNYLNGDKNAPLAVSLKEYLDGLGEDGRTSYLGDVQNSFKSTQDYTTKRSTGWAPEYVNNTYNPAPWGRVDAGDFLNGGTKLQEQMEYYLKYGVSPFDPNPQLEQQLLGQQNPMMGGQQTQQQTDPIAQMMQQMQQQQLAQEQALQAKLKELEEQNAYKQSQVSAIGGQNSGGGTTGSAGHVYSPGSTSNTTGYKDNQVVQNEVFNKYLNSILKGGF